MPLLTPTPDQAAAILDDLTNPARSLHDVAATHDTTVEALSLWISLPHIAAQLTQIESASARHARLAALNYLPRAVDSLVATLDANTYDQRKANFAPNSPAWDSLRRQSDVARRAAALLYRIANLHPKARDARAEPHRPPHSPSNPPREASPPCSPALQLPSAPAPAEPSETSSANTNPSAPTAPPVQNQPQRSRTIQPLAPAPDTRAPRPPSPSSVVALARPP